MNQRRYGRAFSDGEIAEKKRRTLELVSRYLQNLKEEQQELLDLLNELGPEEFTWLLVQSHQETYQEYTPDPRSHPELDARLDQLEQTGHSIEEIRGSRIGPPWKQNLLRIELPLNADLKEYLPAMQAYQEFFQSLKNPNLLQWYVADEHGQGRTYADLAAELNDAIIAWSKGKTPAKYIQLGLDDFLRKKGDTPENFKLYDSERVRRMVRYLWHKR